MAVGKKVYGPGKKNMEGFGLPVFLTSQCAAGVSWRGMGRKKVETFSGKPARSSVGLGVYLVAPWSRHMATSPVEEADDDVKGQTAPPRNARAAL